MYCIELMLDCHAVSNYESKIILQASPNPGTSIRNEAIVLEVIIFKSGSDSN